jgi:predicted nucleic acid-binding protein
MLFIYWLENNPQFARRVGAIHTRMEERGDQLITGTFTFGEVLAGPYRTGAVKVADEAKRLLRSAVSEVIPFTMETADHYAQIRGHLRLPPADAIHLACAAQAGTDLFLTNDKNLVGKVVPGIQFIASLESQIL